MSSKLRGALVALMAAASLAVPLMPASAASIGSGVVALKDADAGVVENVGGYWYRGRWVRGGWYAGPRRYDNGAAVGAGIALGILGAAAIAGAANAPPPDYYDPPDYGPPSELYLEEPAPRPRSCWIETGRGRGYWSPC